MPTRSPVFEKTYHTYLSQVGGIDLKRISKIVDVKSAEKGVLIRYFDKEYHVSKDGVVDVLDHTPPFDICVVLLKYLLLCPDKISLTKGWIPFREIKSATPGIGFFSHDVQHAVTAHYSGRLTDFKKAALALGGCSPMSPFDYDLSVQFVALPRIPILLLFNDADAEFEASCLVLFESCAKGFLDPECLAMVGAKLARELIAKSRYSQ